MRRAATTSATSTITATAQPTSCRRCRARPEDRWYVWWADGEADEDGQRGRRGHRGHRGVAIPDDHDHRDEGGDHVAGDGEVASRRTPDAPVRDHQLDVQGGGRDEARRGGVQRREVGRGGGDRAHTTRHRGPRDHRGEGRGGRASRR